MEETSQENFIDYLDQAAQERKLWIEAFIESYCRATGCKTEELELLETTSIVGHMTTITYRLQKYIPKRFYNNESKADRKE